MSDYIKREDAKAAIREHFNSLADRVEINTVINMMPSIDIVRCKECKHFEKNESILRGEWWCDLWADTIEDDGYCSYGKRSKQ